MKTTSREVYGFGPRLSTRRDRASRLAAWVLLVAVVGMIGGWAWA